MPSGNVHNAATSSIIIAVSASHFVIKEPKDLGLVAIGLGLGFLLSPDLDVDGGFIAFGKLKRIPVVGRLLASVWRIAWYPYALLMPHRSFLSHFPIFSTLIRYCYLFLVAYAISFLFRYDEQLLAWITVVGFRTWLLILYGNTLADSSHWIMDNAEPDKL